MQIDSVGQEPLVTNIELLMHILGGLRTLTFVSSFYILYLETYNGDESEVARLIVSRDAVAVNVIQIVKVASPSFQYSRAVWRKVDRSTYLVEKRGLFEELAVTLLSSL